MPFFVDKSEIRTFLTLKSDLIGENKLLNLLYIGKTWQFEMEKELQRKLLHL